MFEASKAAAKAQIKVDQVMKKAVCIRFFLAHVVSSECVRLELIVMKHIISEMTSLWKQMNLPTGSIRKNATRFLSQFEHQAV